MRSKKYKYIVKDGNSYRVRIRVGLDEYVKKYFLDIGDAIAWRNKQLVKYDLLDRLAFTKAPDYFKQTKRHPIIGVYKNKATGINWTAKVGPNDEKRSFSINLYGNKKAFILACRARYEYAGKLRVINRAALPCRPDVPFTVLKNQGGGKLA